MTVTPLETDRRGADERGLERHVAPGTRREELLVGVEDNGTDEADGLRKQAHRRVQLVNAEQIGSRVARLQ
ncbi:MAG TPA: hypothetical protein VNM37_22075, partial [Candidatus Dormibacteraeota bacterium]|nr:hypothetical protein [Candidatus Dormibacteraeota bacterium]